MGPAGKRGKATTGQQGRGWKGLSPTSGKGQLGTRQACTLTHVFMTPGSAHDAEANVCLYRVISLVNLTLVN